MNWFITVPYIQKYEYSLEQKYSELKTLYNELKTEVQEMFKGNLEDEVYGHKLKHDVDVTVLDVHKKRLFAEYETEIQKRIKVLLQERYLLEEKTLEEVFEVRKELMHFNKEVLSLDTIGTVLNDLREFFNDIEIDIERHKRKFHGIYKLAEQYKPRYNEIQNIELTKGISINEEIKSIETSEKNGWVVSYGKLEID